MSQPDFSLFVSSEPGHTVLRYGVPGRILIGAKRKDGVTTWDPEKVVAIPRAEAERHAKEYARDIRTRALRERKREEWEAQQAALLAAESAAAKTAQSASAAPSADTP